MDKRDKRIEVTDKKTDYKVKDRGDLRKVGDKTLKKSEGKTQVNMKVAYPERGDSGERKISTNQKREKIRLNNVVKKPTNEESKSKYLIHRIPEKEFPNKKSYDKDVMAKSHSELRKRIRDRYTIKLNSPGIQSDHLTMYNSKMEDSSKVAGLKTDANKLAPSPPLKRQSASVERLNKQLSEETTQTKENLIRSSNTSNKTDIYKLDNKPNIILEKKTDFIPEKKPEKVPVKPEKIMAKLKVENHSAKKRKPMIKTIMSETGSVRMFKAVTFVEQRNYTPLEIKIPGHVIKKQQKVSKFTETTPLKFKPKITVSKASVKQEKTDPVRKKTERKRDRKFRHVLSPECSIKECLSPPTEVARWVPASIDAQTKPYYEAWVDTTLTAISKNSKKDKLFYAKQEALLQSFRKVLEERPVSPDLFYESFADENYAGRIKIRQTDRIRKK